MASLMQSKRTKRQAARQNSAKMAISDARFGFYPGTAFALL